MIRKGIGGTTCVFLSCVGGHMAHTSTVPIYGMLLSVAALPENLVTAAVEVRLMATSYSFCLPTYGLQLAAFGNVHYMPTKCVH